MSALFIACGSSDPVDQGGGGGAACPAGATSCSGICRDLLTDTANCGACGNACTGGTVCDQGTCAATCSTGLTSCNGACVNLASDTSHCGSCGTTCKATERCNASKCEQVCADGQAICNQACVSIATDKANCGGCGIACVGNQTCTGGRCIPPECPDGQRLSDDQGTCVACKAPVDLGAVNFWRLDESNLATPVADTGTSATKANGTYLGTNPEVVLGTSTEAYDGNKSLTVRAKTVSSGVLVEPYAMPTAELSVSMWLRVAPTTVGYALFAYASPNPGGSGNAFTILRPNGPGGLVAYVGSGFYETGAVTPDTGAWNMLVVTWSSTTKAVTIYLNGEQAATGTVDSTFTTNGRLYLGQEQDAPPPAAPALDMNQAFAGALDDVAVFDRVLTAEEVKEAYRGYRCR
ncbi:MAG TPA: LamG-like jellyroll fold domain-containing protein [Labilithrix sp.]|nr:LamG-like jellyroll fold domain-containing protein [Labilithrix sp.]